MKQTLKTVSTFIAALSMVLILSITAFAATATFNNHYSTTTSYYTIASISTSNKTGLNCKINIFSYANARCDILMLGKNGQKVWEGIGVIPAGNQITPFWCGSDVYTVKIKAGSKTISGGGTPFVSGSCNRL